MLRKVEDPKHLQSLIINSYSNYISSSTASTRIHTAKH